MTPTITPTIGRIVIAKGLNPVLNNGASEAPAIITRVWSQAGDGRWTVNARVLSDHGTTGDTQQQSRYLFDDQSAAEGWLAQAPDHLDVPVYLVWPARA